MIDGGEALALNSDRDAVAGRPFPGTQEPARKEWRPNPALLAGHRVANSNGDRPPVGGEEGRSPGSRTGRNGFSQRVRQTFAPVDAALVLKARACALERLPADQAGSTRAADLLLGYYADPVVVTAALLLPLRQQQALAPDRLRALFGDAPADLVEAALRPDTLYTATEAQYMADLRLFLESIAHDLRLATLKISLRLAQLEALSDPNETLVRATARETMDLYVPLADRLGLGLLRAQLEDASFRILEPATYRELERAVEPIRREDAVCLSLLEVGVRRLLSRHGIQARVQGRTKGLYSLYRKMRRRQCSVQEIMDVIGLRVVVSSEAECYAVLGLLHTHFRPVPGAFDDYIGLPKDNGYQALHTCIYPAPGVSAKPVEIQIRTEDMDRQAQFGIAAHWRYKSERNRTLARDGHVQWLRAMLAHHERSPDRAEFVERLRRQVFDDRLVVFGPDGRQARLPEGATVQDLIERYEAQPGKGYLAHVNGAPQPLDHPLRDGDIVDWTEEGAPPLSEGEGIHD